MKILMINDHGVQGGGVSSYIINLRKSLEKHGHIVKILSDSRHANNCEYKYKGVSDHGILLRSLYRLFNPYSYFSILHVTKLFKPDIIHMHNALNEGSPSIIAGQLGKPIVMTLHDYSSIGQGFKLVLDKNNTSVKIPTAYKIVLRVYEYFISLVRNLSLRNIDIFIAPASRICKDYKHLGIKNTVCIPHGIPLFRFAKVEIHSNLLYVGRLSSEKGVACLINAMNKMLLQKPYLHLSIIGEGQEKLRLMEMVKILHLEKSIDFEGYVSHKNIEDHYRKSSILIMPSICEESFGLVGIEAMSVGRPVIASNVGGIPEWLDDGKTGYLVDPGNSDQIAEKVIKLLSNRKLLEQMGKNARKKAEQFSIEKHVDKIEKIYKEVIAKYPKK